MKQRPIFSRSILVLALSVPALAMAVNVKDGVHQPESDYSSVNDGLRIGSNARVGDLDTVNGSIRVGSRSRAGRIESINGGIDIDEGAEIAGIEAVNGGIELDRDVHVKGDIESVNGGIRTAEGSHIDGSVTSINGGMDLNGTTVDGDLITYQGDIELRGSEVGGDLYVRKPRMSWFGRNEATVVDIGPGSVIHGDLHFEKKVRLSIDASAKVGEIHGDEVEMVNDARGYK